MKNIDRKIINILALIIVLLVNYLANAIPINGNTVKDISDQFNVLFTPAAYVFSIWALIYLLLIAFVIYQALPKYGDSHYIGEIGYLFSISCVLNSAWIFAWHYNLIAISVIVMIGLLVTLAFIYTKLDNNDYIPTKTEKLLIKLPFSIYLGWISVATIANISVYLYKINWSGWGISHLAWTIIMIVIGVILALYFAYEKKDIAFPLVFVWAFVGIGVNNTGIGLLAFVSWFISALIIVVIFLLFYQHGKMPKLSKYLKEDTDKLHRND